MNKHIEEGRSGVKHVAALQRFLHTEVVLQPISPAFPPSDTYTDLSLWSMYTVSGYDLADIYFLGICKGKYLIFDATWHSPSQNTDEQGSTSATELYVPHAVTKYGREMGLWEGLYFK